MVKSAPDELVAFGEANPELHREIALHEIQTDPYGVAKNLVDTSSREELTPGGVFQRLNQVRSLVEAALKVLDSEDRAVGFAPSTWDTEFHELLGNIARKQVQLGHRAEALQTLDLIDDTEFDLEWLAELKQDIQGS